MRASETVTSDEILRRYLAGERDFSGLEIEDSADSAAFRGAVLDEADFSHSFIVADFQGASLRHARFTRANVKTCSYAEADLTNADFSGAILCSTTFLCALMRGAMFERAHFHSRELLSGEVPDW